MSERRAYKPYIPGEADTGNGFKIASRKYNSEEEESSKDHSTPRGYVPYDWKSKQEASPTSTDLFKSKTSTATDPDRLSRNPYMQKSISSSKKKEEEDDSVQSFLPRGYGTANYERTSKPESPSASDNLFNSRTAVATAATSDDRISRNPYMQKSASSKKEAENSLLSFLPRGYGSAEDRTEEEKEVSSGTEEKYKPIVYEVSCTKVLFQEKRIPKIFIFSSFICL